MRAKTKIDKTDQIAVTDESGNLHFLDEYTRFAAHQTLSGPPQWVRGSRSLMLGREHVNCVDDNTFEVVMTGQRLKRAQ